VEDVEEDHSRRESPARDRSTDRRPLSAHIPAFSTFSDLEPAIRRSESRDSTARKTSPYRTMSRSLELRPSQGSRQPSGVVDEEETQEPDEMQGLMASVDSLPKGHHTHTIVSHPDIHGMALLTSGDFWTVFGILALCK